MTFGSLMRRERTDPFFQELVDFRKSFDELFGRVWPLASAAGNESWVPPMESYVEKGTFHVRLQAPDIDAKDISIEVRGNQLRIAGDAKREKETTERNYIAREFSYGSFERLLPLPEGVKPEGIEASYNKGVLEITAPIAEKSLPRKIEVKGISEPGKRVAA